MKYTRIVRKVAARACGTVAVGVDMSLTGTGLAVVEDGRLARVNAWTDVKKLQHAHRTLLCWFKPRDSSESSKAHRLGLITNWVIGQIALAQMRAPKVVVALEGYAFSKRSTSSSGLHELGGMIKGRLWDAGIPFRVYDPSSIKLYWTGNGASKKPAMVKAAVGRFAVLSHELPRLLTESEDAAGNIADAALIAALLHDELKLKAGLLPLAGMSEHERRVMMRVTRAEPEALVTRPFIGRVPAPAPILAQERGSG